MVSAFLHLPRYLAVTLDIHRTDVSFIQRCLAVTVHVHRTDVSFIQRCLALTLDIHRPGVGLLWWFGDLDVKSKNVLNKVVNVWSKVVGERQEQLSQL